MSKRVSNRATKDKKRRRKLRLRMETEGIHPAVIEEVIAKRRFEDLVARVGLEQARIHLNNHAHVSDPDDTGYEPTAGDPLLRGAGRVSGIAAKVVGRRHTITHYQHGRMKI